MNGDWGKRSSYGNKEKGNPILEGEQHSAIQRDDVSIRTERMAGN